MTQLGIDTPEFVMLAMRYRLTDNKENGERESCFA